MTHDKSSEVQCVFGPPFHIIFENMSQTHKHTLSDLFDIKNVNLSSTTSVSLHFMTFTEVFETNNAMRCQFSVAQ